MKYIFVPSQVFYKVIELVDTELSQEDLYDEARKLSSCLTGDCPYYTFKLDGEKCVFVPYYPEQPALTEDFIKKYHSNRVFK